MFLCSTEKETIGEKKGNDRNRRKREGEGRRKEEGSHWKYGEKVRKEERE